MIVFAKNILFIQLNIILRSACTWRKPLHSEHTKSYLTVSIGYQFLLCPKCSGFLFFQPNKNAVLVIYHLGGDENNL